MNALNAVRRVLCEPGILNPEADERRKNVIAWAKGSKAGAGIAMGVTAVAAVVNLYAMVAFGSVGAFFRLLLSAALFVSMHECYVVCENVDTLLGGQVVQEGGGFVGEIGRMVGNVIDRGVAAWSAENTVDALIRNTLVLPAFRPALITWLNQR